MGVVGVYDVAPVYALFHLHIVPEDHWMSPMLSRRDVELIVTDVGNIRALLPDTEKEISTILRYILKAWLFISIGRTFSFKHNVDYCHQWKFFLLTCYNNQSGGQLLTVTILVLVCFRSSSIRTMETHAQRTQWCTWDSILVTDEDQKHHGLG